MALDATIGGASSNSFCTVAEADDYLADRFDVNGWDNYGTREKEEVLIAAADILDYLEWDGTPETTTQALQWPRIDTVDRFGNALTGVPDVVKNAQAALAFALITQEYVDADIAFSHINIDGVIMDASGKRGLPSKVTRLIKHLYTDRSYVAKVHRT